MGQQRIDRGTAQGWLALTLVIGGRPRTFAPKPWLCLLLAAVMPLLGAWYLGATLYVVFHDQLLASLIARQTDVQYAYEDKIAGLSTQLDRETSRSLIDRHMLETTLRDLEARSARLESRAALLDRLVARNAVAPDPTASINTRALSRPLSSPNPLLGDRRTALPDGVSAYTGSPALPARVPEAAPLLRRSSLDDDKTVSPSGAIDTSASLVPPSIQWTSAKVDTALVRVERDQDHALQTLREPTLQTIVRLRTALNTLGLPAGAAPTSDTGGPFIPLPAGRLDFEQNAALLQDALREADHLTGLVAKVPLRKPVTGPLEVTSTFGPRIDPFLGRPAMHTGIDFREPFGESVRATAAGTVTIAGPDGGYGTMVEVDHGGGLSTRYAHLSSASVVPGQKVVAGDVVGRVGSSGRATGPHLHYETRINGEAVDPTRFLKVGARLYDE